MNPNAVGENRVARPTGRELFALSRADVFVTAGSGYVLGYARTGGNPVETIVTQAGGAAGLAFDRKGNLYVSDEGGVANPADVEIFAPGSTTPFMTVVNAALAQPVRVAVDPQGNIWVANNADKETDPGNLLEFSKKGVLLQTIACSGLSRYGGGLAADNHGNVFVQGATSAGYLKVEEVPAGHSNCVVLPAKSVFFGGVAVTQAGDLVVGDSYRRHALTYAAPSFKKVIATTTFLGMPRSGLNAIALTKDGAGIWTTSVAGKRAVLLYRYARTEKPSVRISPPSPGDVAVDY